ncbi:DUF2147 domain-containing protein [uncultured Cohaesibacter sp.]|uniref:DUF2147 domain-containing protein n=1 Tax=uncultured Cohaesibacter sp. TaxID=1002546 RepID=UPI0029C73B99|nr:DUF2147 domain-containing protein [uncultured Cohaesibacter sp.]
MRKSLLALPSAALLMASPALAADPVYGDWKSAPGDGGAYVHVKIGPCGSKICGKITKVVGKKNPTSLGKSIIKNMNADGSGKYSGGTIWAPDKDKTYSSKMKLSGNKLSVSGCVAGGLICRSQTWTRL